MEIKGVLFQCTKCLQPHKNAEQSWCTACHNRYMREWRKRTQISPEEKARWRARSIAHAAKRKGLIEPQPCERCQSSNVQMHHEDYNKPTEVRWLCAPCHRDEHDEQANKRLSDKPENWIFPEDKKWKETA